MTPPRTQSLWLAAAVAALPALGVAAVPTPPRVASLSQEPVIMRLSKDEFRIAFGVDAAHCAASAQGCTGVIRYRVDWKTEDGLARSEVKHVNYAIAPQSRRGMTVDRQYFDTAEGAHMTEVLKVSVDLITCVDAADTRTASITRS